jgi:hypothetical protein
MFGVLQGCGCHFTKVERQEWMAHVCGLCLALRRGHGQISRLTTNYDAALLSVLYEAQASEPAQRRSHLCPLRPGLRGNVVPDDQPGARYAAAVCALTGATKIADHIADAEGWPSRLPTIAGGLADRWAQQARLSAGALGFQTELIESQARRQASLEQQPAQEFGFFARPTELAVGAAFGHTAALAQLPANVMPLEQVGQMYGRIMYLLDSYRDYTADIAAGKFNALARCYPAGDIQRQARQLFRQAHGALVESFGHLTLARPTLARKLLVMRLHQIGEETIGVSASDGGELVGEAVQAAGKRKRKPEDESWCGDCGDCGSGCDGCDICCCHGCDCCGGHSSCGCGCNCCDCNGCDGCDCNCCDCG